MSQKEKRPSIKESVGGLRYCFATTNEVDPQIFSGKYEEEVAVSNVVKSIKRTENGDTTPVYASGRDYDTVSDTSSVDSEVEVVAFDPTDLAKMRGDEITESGLILKGGSSERPFFAFGQTVFCSQPCFYLCSGDHAVYFGVDHYPATDGGSSNVGRN